MSARTLILNADDFGYDPQVSLGIALAMREGIVSSTTMMVNTPHSAHAAALAEGLSIGLHLNLARWQAVSKPSRTFIEADASALEPSFVEDETSAQLERLAALLGRHATHIDVHKHLHQLPTVLTGVVNAAKRHRLPVRSPDEATRLVLRAAGVRTNDVMLGDAGTDAYWTLTQLERTLEQLPSTGVIELMCHPGYAPSHVKSGYATQREVELATFTAARSKARLASLGVQFESWARV